MGFVQLVQEPRKQMGRCRFQCPRAVNSDCKPRLRDFVAFHQFVVEIANLSWGWKNPGSSNCAYQTYTAAFSQLQNSPVCRQGLFTLRWFNRVGFSYTIIQPCTIEPAD